MANYYIRNQYTGESSTREFVERFITNWASPDECERSLYDSIFGITHGGMQDTYMAGAKASRDSRRDDGTDPPTIGRTSRLSDGKNADEILWCMKIDISKACKRLTKRQRDLLTYRYVYDLTDQQIATLLNISKWYVSRLASRAFDALAWNLDHGKL